MQAAAGTMRFGQKSGDQKHGSCLFRVILRVSDNWRVLMLLSVMNKGFSRIILGRLSTAIDTQLRREHARKS